MVSLSKKLAKLKSAETPSAPLARMEEPDTCPTVDPNDAGSPAETPVHSVVLGDRAARLAQLKDRLRAMAEVPKKPRVTPQARSASVAQAVAELPFTRTESSEGPSDARSKFYDVTQRHGHVALHSARDADGAAIATLALDVGLVDFAAERALFLDTETTGLSGGTGMLAFLVGLGRFESDKFIVEQLFVREPCEEAAMLVALRDRIENASALVTFNGKSFDWPLLRARYVMNRLVAPKVPPHLDLLHVSRRVYGKRTTQCKLTTLEREVLGFVREDDVDGSEIPGIYSRFLREGAVGPMHAVLEHNLWDVIAMAALVGELSARVRGDSSPGRFEASDMAGLANTALRAGDSKLALALAVDAVHTAGEDLEVVSRAGTIAAKIHRKKRSYRDVHQSWQQVLSQSPDDSQAHLELAKLFEHHYRDPYRALSHALRAVGAEKDGGLERRIARLKERVRFSTLRLPGID